MDLKNLEYIVAIAEAGNISHAADRLFISQPALSQYLLKLEQDLGVPLFNRIKNALTPTYAGEIYIESAREILNIKKQTYNKIGDIIDLKKGRIVIGISPDRGAIILPQVFSKFYEKYPGIKIELVEEIGNNLETLTLQGHIDFSIITYDGYKTPLDYETLCHEEIILVVPKSHKMAYLASNAVSGKRPVVDLSLFKNEPFVLMRQGSKTRQISDYIFRDIGITPNVILETRTINTVQNTVSNGTALTLMPERIINYTNYGSNLVFFSISPQKYYWSIIAIYRKDFYMNRAMMDFISIVKSNLNSPIPT